MPASTRWGYQAPDKVLCQGCNRMHHGNEPCEACKGYLCEFCFQTRKQCCDNMVIYDMQTGKPRKPDMYMSQVGQSLVKQKTNPHLHTLQCKSKNCLYRSTFGKYPEPAIVAKKEYGYCPMCGSEAEIVDYDNEAYWSLLAKHYGMPADILREIYKIWNRDEHNRFIDFVKAFKAEALAS